MPRKVKKFESVNHGTFTADIRLDAETGRFSCEYGGQSFESTSLPDVRVWAKTRLRAMSELKWDSIMSVCFSNEDTSVNNLNNCTNLELYIERFHVAWDGKKWVQTPWVVMPPGQWMAIGPNTSDMDQKDHEMPPEILSQQRIARSRIFCAAEKCGNVIKFPLIEGGGMRPTYYVPYSDDRWLTMIGIMEKVRELRTRIHTMLSSAEGWQQLAAIAAVKLLTAPKDETNTL